MFVYSEAILVERKWVTKRFWDCFVYFVYLRQALRPWIVQKIIADMPFTTCRIYIDCNHVWTTSFLWVSMSDRRVKIREFVYHVLSLFSLDLSPRFSLCVDRSAWYLAWMLIGPRTFIWYHTRDNYLVTMVTKAYKIMMILKRKWKVTIIFSIFRKKSTNAL